MNYKELCRVGSEIVPQFKSWANASPYEIKGILHSEMLFLVSVLRSKTVGRIIESGRARGQSTLMLSLAFPENQIISIEFDANSPDVAVAQSRLGSHANVDLRFGDSRKLLPELVKSDDYVLIDGPKAFRAVRLAMRVLATGRCAGVFIHDLYPGQDERAFVDRHFPEAQFSDDRRWAEFGSVVDADIMEFIPPEQRLDTLVDGRGYGFSLTFLPYRPDRNYSALEMLAKVTEIFSKLKRSLFR